MRSWSYTPMDAHRKKLVALRMYYLGGYTHYFSDHLAKLLSDGYTNEEIIAAIIAFAIPTIIYYVKRKPLFGFGTTNSAQSKAPSQPKPLVDLNPSQEKPPQPVSENGFTPQEPSVIDSVRAFSVQQAECIRAYPDFNYTEEMDNKRLVKSSVNCLIPALT